MENNVELDSLRHALEQHGIMETLVPNWIPEGYRCVSVNAKETPKAMRISAMYEKDGVYLIIEIRQIVSDEPHQIEKSENLIETYSADGVDYYIFSNNESLQTAWIMGEYECLIIGELTVNDMKRVIDSI